MAFRDGYLACYMDRSLAVLDVGSAAVTEDSGTYRMLFEPNWHYVGLDVSDARNVDIVVEDPYSWAEVEDASFDVVVSGQSFEHIEWPWLTILEIARVLKVNGFAVIAAPSAGAVHRYPVDCWRFYPDAFPALARFAGLNVVECHTSRTYAYPECADWGDVFAVLQRPARDAADEIKLAERQQLVQTGSGSVVRRAAPLDVPVPKSVIDPARCLNVFAQREATVLASLAPVQVKRHLLLGAAKRVYQILRTPLHRLERP
jgi:SAM-dependent methyltransferase